MERNKKSGRRQFVKSIGALAALSSVGSLAWSKSLRNTQANYESKPWLELSKAAYLHNAAQISKMANGKPIVAVLKNNAYGVGNVEVAQILDQSQHIFGMAVVTDKCALAMRIGGVTKPILLMGDFDSILFNDLIEKEITLSIHSNTSFQKIINLARGVNKQIKVALYIDTGLGRMGIPYQGVIALAKKIKRQPQISIEQTFSTLTTPRDFAIEQIDRFDDVVSKIAQLKIPTGLKHLAPSYSMLDISSSHQQAVRPGILLHGSFPMAKMQAAKKYPLQVPYRLKAPVIRLEKLKAGDTIGFSRFYKIERDEWIATLPVGWADGYYSGAENGAMVLLADQLFKVVNVNASHVNISLGADTTIQVGDVATLTGSDRLEITPEGFAELTGGHNYLQINYKESIAKRVYETF